MRRVVISISAWLCGKTIWNVEKCNGNFIRWFITGNCTSRFRTIWYPVFPVFFPSSSAAKRESDVTYIEFCYNNIRVRVTRYRRCRTRCKILLKINTATGIRPKSSLLLETWNVPKLFVVLLLPYCCAFRSYCCFSRY